MGQLRNVEVDLADSGTATMKDYLERIWKGSESDSANKIKRRGILKV